MINHIFSKRLRLKRKQKQPTRGTLRKRCSGNMQQIYRRNPRRSVISIKLLCNVLLHIFGALFPKKTSGGLLLRKKLSKEYCFAAHFL